MKNKIKILILIPIIIGIIIGIYYALTNFYSDKINLKKINENVFSILQNKRAELTEFYIYGTNLNVTGKIDGINKDNVETVKLLLTDGLEDEKLYTIDYEFVDGVFIFTSSNEMNYAINLDELQPKKYYLLLRLKLNNSVNYRYFSLENKTSYSNLEYYTVTNNNSNNRVDIIFENNNYKNNEIPYMSISVRNEQLPENVYDIVIDAGHGGIDKGEKSGDYVESEITLDYALSLKEVLEQKGYKIKLTRDGTESDKDITGTSMYNDNGRVNVAQESKAKLLISLHVNNGGSSLNGIEVYAPCNCNLKLAKQIADNVVENVDGIDYSNNEQYKKQDGVYVKNFTKSLIEAFNIALEQQGVEPYNITNDTPYLYIIREVGGIATNAYVDGRNKLYGVNKYLKSNIGIEAYQVELGYIKTDAESLTANKQEYVTQIAEAIEQNFKNIEK